MGKGSSAAILGAFCAIAIASITKIVSNKFVHAVVLAVTLVTTALVQIHAKVCQIVENV